MGIRYLGIRYLGIAIGESIEIALRLRNGRTCMHAAGQKQRGRGGNDGQSKRARDPHLSHPFDGEMT
jgi:hypothetical protein